MMNEHERPLRLDGWLPVSEVLNTSETILMMLRQIFPSFEEAYEEVKGGAMTFFNCETGEISHSADWKALFAEHKPTTLDWASSEPYTDACHDDLLKLVRWRGGKRVGQVVVALDYYGEVKPMFQMLIYNHGTDEETACEVEENETQVCVRYDEHGQVVEVAVAEGIRVVQQEGDASPWIIERDGR